jgi:hypothetical protein
MADPFFLFLAALFFSPAFIFVTHVLVTRLITAMRLTVQPLLTGVLAVVISLAWLAPVTWAIFLKNISLVPDLWVAVLYGILTYGGLAFCYFQVFAMTETARRLHILHELYTKKGMTLSQLEAEYGASQMLETRLHRMVEIGQLNYHGAYYTLRSGLLLGVGRVMSFWAKVLGFGG